MAWPDEGSGSGSRRSGDDDHDRDRPGEPDDLDAHDDPDDEDDDEDQEDETQATTSAQQGLDEDGGSAVLAAGAAWRPDQDDDDVPEAATVALEPVHPVPEWRPLVTLNVAMSLDGKIAAEGGRTFKFSGDADLRRVHALRDRHEAIVVGIGTVLADDPALMVKERYQPGGRSPIRVVLDSRHRTPVTARVASGDAATLLYSVDPEATRAVTRRALHGVEVVATPPDAEGRVEIAAVLADLKERGVDSLLVEGGTRVLTSFLAAGLVDRISLYMAPVIMGEEAPPLVYAKAAEEAHPLAAYRRELVEPVGHGWVVHLAPVAPPG